MTKAAELAKMGEVLTNSQIGGRRNIIINGAMKIDQRNNGSSVNLANAKVYAVDRFFWIESSSETPTGQRVADAPVGFTHSNKITNTSTTTTPTYTQLNCPVEGNNITQLYFGNSSAKTVTLSFYVKSSLTGQFSAAIRNGDDNRSNVSTYTINSANTWERKIITFVGDTTGTWATDNTIGLSVIFRLDDTGGTSSLNQWTASGNAFASGSVRFMGNASATWQITGIQLEEGSQATPFEHRSLGEELALCQRYYQILPKYTFMVAVEVGTTSVRGGLTLPTNMRANPTIGSHNLTRYDDDDNTFSNKTPVVFSNSGSDNQSDPEVGGQSGQLSLAYNSIMSGGTDNHNVTTLFGTQASLDAEL